MTFTKANEAEQQIVKLGLRRHGMKVTKAVASDYADASSFLQMLGDGFVGDRRPEFRTAFERLSEDLDMDGATSRSIAFEAVGLECVRVRAQDAAVGPKPSLGDLIEVFVGMEPGTGENLLDHAARAIDAAREAIGEGVAAMSRGTA